ncbi:hypothetical protein GW17_00056612 [Ensete ventricosum]|nr:hypothetical protein GW17_00056612 [Ensete ventricosum]
MSSDSGVGSGVLMLEWRSPSVEGVVLLGSAARSCKEVGSGRSFYSGCCGLFVPYDLTAFMTHHAVAPLAIPGVLALFQGFKKGIIEGDRRCKGGRRMRKRCCGAKSTNGTPCSSLILFAPSSTPFLRYLLGLNPVSSAPHADSQIDDDDDAPPLFLLPRPASDRGPLPRPAAGIDPNCSSQLSVSDEDEAEADSAPRRFFNSSQIVDYIYVGLPFFVLHQVP